MFDSKFDPEGRYARQIQFSPIGVAGQARIQAARVAVLGVGALGSVAAELLGRAGVAHLTLIDRDLVEWTNLQRQALYDENDARAAAAKVEAAAGHLRRIRSDLDIRQVVVDVTAANLAESIGEVDLVIDAADNFTLRLLLNDWSLENQKPWVHGGCVGATGQVRLFDGKTPCLRCLVPNIPDPSTVATCDTAGVLGAATHVIASLQVAEAIKWLSDNRQRVSKNVRSVDLWRGRITDVRLDEATSPQCPACKLGRREFLDGTASPVAAEKMCGRCAVQVHSVHRGIDLGKIADRWEPLGHVERSSFFTRLTTEDDVSLTLFRDGRAVIVGVDDVAVGRTLYDRYVGS